MKVEDDIRRFWDESQLAKQREFDQRMRWAHLWQAALDGRKEVKVARARRTNTEYLWAKVTVACFAIVFGSITAWVYIDQAFESETPDGVQIAEIEYDKEMGKACLAKGWIYDPADNICSSGE